MIYLGKMVLINIATHSNITLPIITGINSLSASFAVEKRYAIFEIANLTPSCSTSAIVFLFKISNTIICNFENVFFV